MVIETNPWNKASLLIGIVILGILLVSGSFVACQKAEEGVSEEEAAAEQENLKTFEGTAKVVVGKYIFVPEARGFDIVLQGELVSGETESLVGKEIRGEGEISPERPSVLIANTLEVKEEGGTWQNVFTRTEEVSLEDYLDTSTRGEFEILEDLSYDKKRVWEGKEKAKIYGRLEKTNGDDVIFVLDGEGKQVGKVLVDVFTDFGEYYHKKLRLFDKYWFYVNIKETVDWRERRRTREMFHADVMFAGLF
jgi:hypothetical protein